MQDLTAATTCTCNINRHKTRMPVPVHPNKPEIPVEKEDENSNHSINIQNNELDEGKSSLRELWWQFLSETTCHGFGRVGILRRNKLRGLLWLLFLLTSMFTIIWFLVDEFRSYYSYPYLSKTSLETFKRMPFPAVTICNMGSKNKSRSSKTEKDTRYWFTISSLASFSAEEVDWNDSYYQENGYFQPGSIEEEFSMGMDVSKFILTSTFDFMGQLVFEPVLTSLGVCYTWNGKGNVTSKMSGSLYNLHLVLDVNRELYEAGVTTSTGVKVVVHEPGTTADPINQGFVVGPGMSALASVTKKRFTFLPYPFEAFLDGYCLDTQTADFVNRFHPHPYSVGICKRFCYSELIYKKCGCVHVSDVGNRTVCSRYQYSECYLKELGMWQLWTRWIQKRGLGLDSPEVRSDIQCNCTYPCESVTFDVMVSTNQFPSDLFAQVMGSHLNMSVERIRSNLLEIRIFYDKLYYLWMRQIPKYERIGDVLASIGGQMGLFIGASVLTVMEFIEILFLVFLFIVKRLSSKRRNSLQDIGA